MENSKNKKILVSDIECNGLYDECTTMWCAVTHDITTGETKTFSDYSEQIIDGGSEDYLKELDSADVVIGHNFVSYDLPVLKKLFGYEFEGEVVDTLILSKLFWFSRPRVRGAATAHSLAAWGIRTGTGKPEQEQWEEFEESMINRCQKDVVINTKTYEVLMKEKADQPGIDKAIAIEHRVAEICFQQYLNGWPVDFDKLEENIKYLDEEIERLVSEVEPLIPAYVKPKDGKATWEEVNELLDKPWKKVPITKMDHLGKPVRPAVKPFKPKILKSGLYDRYTALWFGIPQENALGERLVAGPYTRITFERVKLSQDALVKKFLLSIGWVPTQWNFKKDSNGKILRDDQNKPIPSSPKLSEDSFDSIEGELGQKIARHHTLVHRRNTLENINDPENKGWKALAKKDGRVHCETDPLGAATSRATHKGLVNVPGVKSLYGREMREVFTHSEDEILVGSDSSAAQLRLLAANMKDDNYVNIVVSGQEEDEDGNFLGTDVHTSNGRAFGLINEDLIEWLKIHNHDHPEYESKHDMFSGLRGQSKNGIYCLLFGGGDAKMGQTIKGTAADGKRLKKQFLDGFPKLANLLNRLNEEWNYNKNTYKEGWIVGLDGRRVYCESNHKLLNYLLQSDEAIMMKYVMVKADNLIRKNNIRAKQLVWMHDEINFSCHPDDQEKLVKILDHSYKVAAEQLSIYCPMDSGIKVGDNWGMIH